MKEEYIKIIPGKLIFTETDNPIRFSGETIPDTGYSFFDYWIEKRKLPVIGNDFKPTGKTHEAWAAIRGNHSYFFTTKYKAEHFAITGEWLK